MHYPPRFYSLKSRNFIQPNRFSLNRYLQFHKDLNELITNFFSVFISWLTFYCYKTFNKYFSFKSTYQISCIFTKYCCRITISLNEISTIRLKYCITFIVSKKFSVENNVSLYFVLTNIYRSLASNLHRTGDCILPKKFVKRWILILQLIKTDNKTNKHRNYVTSTSLAML